MKFGAHMPTSGGVWRALERGCEIGCDIIQIFVKNNLQWLGKPFSPDDVEAFARKILAARMDCVFGHTGYLINLASPDSVNRLKSIQSLTQEIQLATALGLPFLVLHPGAHLGSGEEAGLRQTAESLNQVFEATAESPVRIALENTAGQGSCLGHRVAHLGAIYERVKKTRRLGVCLDTAHFYAAGYDLRTDKGWKEAVSEVKREVGLKEILAFHLNDSKVGLGSRVDRHAGIGQGHIGLDAFKTIVNDSRFALTPGCLETPKSPDLHEDVENLRVLRSLQG
jgi:deoxyribonuclease-4